MENARVKRVKQFFAVLRGFCFQKFKKKLAIFVFTLFICVFSTLIYTSVSMYLFSATINSKGVVKTLGVGVYWDDVCSKPVSYIDWGIVDPALQKNVTVYVRNEGSISAFISLDTTNWDPVNASSYMTLGWDYSGQLLKPDESVAVMLTLSISPTIQNITIFTFDIMITQVQ
jgi:hypothetical protein